MPLAGFCATACIKPLLLPQPAHGRALIAEELNLVGLRMPGHGLGQSGQRSSRGSGRLPGSGHQTGQPHGLMVQARTNAGQILFGQPVYRRFVWLRAAARIYQPVGGLVLNGGGQYVRVALLQLSRRHIAQPPHNQQG